MLQAFGEVRGPLALRDLGGFKLGVQGAQLVLD